MLRRMHELDENLGIFKSAQNVYIKFECLKQAVIFLLHLEFFYCMMSWSCTMSLCYGILLKISK
jgi:hypothetical protein